MKLPQDIVPTTFEQAVDLLYLGLEEKDRESICEHSVAAFHHWFGTDLRNGWSIWDRMTPLSLHFQKRFRLVHGDDLSGMIMGSLWARVRGEVFDAEAQAAKYIAHWEGLGIDSMTFGQGEESKHEDT
jgi:hypothetical protein